MVTNVKPRIRYYDTADQLGNRGLAIKRMRAVNDQSSIDRLLAGFFWIEGRHGSIDGWRCGCTTAARDNPGARRCRIDIETTCHRDWLHELSHLGLVVRFDDHIQRVFTTDNGFTMDTDSVLANIGAAHVIE